MKIFPILCGVILLAGATAFADDDLRSVQQQLKDAGYYFGTVDGNSGKETNDAVRRYQIRNGLDVSGQLDEKTRAALQKEGVDSNAPSVPTPPAATSTPRPDLRSAPSDSADQGQQFLRKQTPPPPAPEPAARDDGIESGDYAQMFRKTPYETAPPVVQRDTIRRAKARLAEAGYFRGPLDEIPDGRLADSLRAFQARRGMKPTGRLDLETLNRLRLMPRMERAPAPGPVVRGVWLR